MRSRLGYDSRTSRVVRLAPVSFGRKLQLGWLPMLSVFPVLNFASGVATLDV